MSAEAFEKPVQVTQSDINAAASAEQSALKDSQLKYLLDRVVSLRVELDQVKRTADQANARIKQLESLIPQDEPEKEPEKEPADLDETPVD